MTHRAWKTETGHQSGRHKNTWRSKKGIVVRESRRKRRNRFRRCRRGWPAYSRRRLLLWSTSRPWRSSRRHTHSLDSFSAQSVSLVLPHFRFKCSLESILFFIRSLLLRYRKNSVDVKLLLDGSFSRPLILFLSSIFILLINFHFFSGSFVFRLVLDLLYSFSQFGRPCP